MHGPHIKQLEKTGATVEDGPRVAGTDWLRVTTSTAVFYLPAQDHTGLKLLAERRAKRGKPAEKPKKAEAVANTTLQGGAGDRR